MLALDPSAGPGAGTATERAEAVAVLRLRLAKRLTSEASRPEKVQRLQNLVKEFPGTKASEEAAKILDEMKEPKPK